MIHPHYVFWVVAPVGFLLLWYAMPRSTRLAYALAALLMHTVVILSGADYAASPKWPDDLAGLLLVVPPLLVVLAVALGGWGFFRRRYPWLPLLVFPVAYYLGVTAGITIGMATGILSP
jgi:hypothetical protein